MILGIGTFFQKLMISLVGGVYQIVNYTYQIFMVLAETNIFEQSDYASLTEKIYVILGVVMMFIIAYNFLTLVVDPDKNKGGAAVEKTLKNIVISFILIVLCPSLFSFAFKVSDAIMNQGIFANFFSNVEIDDNCGKRALTIKDGGNLMAGTTFAAFFNAADGDDEGVKASGNTLAEVKCESITKGSFAVYKDFAEQAADGDVEFNWFVSLIAGVYLCYVIISFSFDLAVRIIKLAFYQIIAPIAIAARILPKQEDVFTNWKNATIKTYISSFIRVFIMNISIYLISIFEIKDFFSDKFSGQTSFGVIAFANVFIILGIVTFMKVASKLLDDIFKFGDVSLGIKEKLKTGGAFAAGSAIGSGLTSMVRNASHAINNVKDAKGGKAKAGALMKGVGSVVAGGASGVYRGARAGQNAGSWSETVMASSKGATATVDARDARESRKLRYKASGKNVVTGRLSDWGHDIKDWATGGAEQYDGMIKLGQEFDSKSSAMEAATEKMMSKFKGNLALVADMDETIFKGSKDQVDNYMRLYNEYKANGMSLADIEADIARQKGITDFATLVDKNRFYSAVDYAALEKARQDAVAAIDKTSAEFNQGGFFDKQKYDDACKAAREAVQEASFRTFDNDGYQAAIESAAIEHGKKVAALDQMYNQLWKESRLVIQDRAMSGDYAAGTKASDYRDIVSVASEFEELFKAHGSYVVDPDDASKQFTHIDHKHAAGHTMDDIASAYKKKGKDAATQSARIRQQASMRKDDKK